MSSGNWTVFTNDAGAAGSTDYVKDEFLDTSLEPTTNGSLTSNSNTNPQNLYFSDTDAPTYQTKTLLFKDLVLVEDRSQWISGKPTYRPIFFENWPAINCYIFGDITILQNKSSLQVQFNVIGDGIGVNGIIRRAGFLIQGSTAATATAQISVDGSNTTTIDFSSSASTSDAVFPAKTALYLHATSNETNGLHDIRCTSIQANTLVVSGIQVYYENSGANIDVRPGTTYVNKNKVTTANGATMAVPSFGSSLGGVGLVYKSSTGGVTVSALSATTIISIAQGSSGTNLLNVSTGTGASYTIGAGILAGAGSTQYYGVITSISTDTLTVAPTLSFGVSGPIYKYWQGGHSYAISATLHQIYDTIDIGQIVASRGASNLGLTSGILPAILDPSGHWALYASNVGIRATEGKMALYFLGGSGTIEINSQASALSAEIAGQGTLGYTLRINNAIASSYSAGLTGAICQTLYTDAGSDWHTTRILPTTSQGVTVGFYKFNLYQRQTDRGVTHGGLARFDVLPAYTDVGAIGAQSITPGTVRRYYADQIYLKGNWTRGITTSGAAAYVFYYGTSGAVLTHRYYGKNVGVIGTVDGGTLSIDGTGVSLGFNGMHTVASVGYHTLQYSVGNGATAIVSAIDVASPVAELESLQNYEPVAEEPSVPTTTMQVFTSGSGVYVPPSGVKWLKVKMVGGGGGGGGSSSDGGTGGTTSFGSILSCVGGNGGVAQGANPGAGGSGGAGTISAGAVGLAVVGGDGQAGGDSGTAGVTPPGGNGGGTPFGGGGQGGREGSVAGGSAPANSGAGGGGSANSGGASSGGGGCGAFIEAVISYPNAFYTYSVGAGGSPGTSGGSAVGGTGGSGAIIVEEHYV